MNLSYFDYNLPEELIAQSPVEMRDHSRLLVYKKENGEILHQNFFDIVKSVCLLEQAVRLASAVSGARAVTAVRRTAF